MGVSYGVKANKGYYRADLNNFRLYIIIVFIKNLLYYY
jgi:hypothetical protein